MRGAFWVFCLVFAAVLAVPSGAWGQSPYAGVYLGTFFGTNETVFTALSASFTGMHGLHESTQTLEAMKEGINKSLETLGEVGSEIQAAALKAGYGPTIRAESVKKLVDAVVGFQERSYMIIEEMRELSTKNEAELTAAVEDGKRRFVALQTGAAALPAPAET